MLLVNLEVLERAALEHPDAAGPLQIWRRIALDAAWRSIVELRRDFPSADGIPIGKRREARRVATVFDIRGNTYRLITEIQYRTQIVRLVSFLTHAEHAEYDKEKWKRKF